MDPRDDLPLSKPTRRRRKPNESDVPRSRTVEERAWPDEARILSVMAHGFSYAEAWHMSWRDYRRYTALASAWSIPYDERDELVFQPTAADADAYT